MCMAKVHGPLLYKYPYRQTQGAASRAPCCSNKALKCALDRKVHIALKGPQSEHHPGPYSLNQPAGILEASNLNKAIRRAAQDLKQEFHCLHTVFKGRR